MVQLRDSGLKIIARNDVLLKHIQDIKLNHLFWDYRRVWAYLNHHRHIHVNRKRIYCVMQVNHLLIKDHRLLRARQQSHLSKPKSNRPSHIWGTDMTKVKLPHIGCAYIGFSLGLE